MQIQTFYPRHPVLKECIEYYYFLKTDSPDFCNTYYAFPNTLHSFNIHKNADCEIKPNYTSVFESRANKYLTVVQGYSQTPMLVSLKGRLDKVTVVFKPLGFHHFIRSPFKAVAGSQSQLFEDWHSPEFTKFLYDFYETSDLEARVSNIENFLMHRYKSFGEKTVLQNIIRILSDFETDYSAREIAAAFSINTRKLNRLFDRHLGIGPLAFRKIARFRRSLENKIYSSQFKTLTEIGYESNFYDQSYFIKIYRNLTGKNPSKFFKSIEKLADNRLVFEFITKKD